MKKTIKYIFYSLLGLFIGLLMVCFIVFNSTQFQTWLTTKVTTYLSAQFKTKITIDRIKYYPLTGFSLDNVYWGDQKNDTLFFVDELKFNFGSFDSKNPKLILNDVIVEGAICNLVTYTDSTFNINVLFNIFDPNDTIPDTLSPPFQLYFNRVALHHSRFRLVDSTTTFNPTGFDGLNQDFKNIELLASEFWIIGDSLHFDLKKLTATERCGIEVKQFFGITTISNKALNIDSFELQTAYSKVGNTFHMQYNSYDDFSDFYSNVKLFGNASNSVVDMRDLQFFTDALEGNTQKFNVNGTATGTVDNLKLRNMQIGFGNNSLFNGSGTIRGLPNVEETFLDIKTSETQTNKIDLEQLITIELPSEMNYLGDMKFEGRYTGFFNDFVANGKFQTAIGSGSSDLNMKLGDSLTPPSYSGKLILQDFDLGKLTNQQTIGKTSLKAIVNGKGFSLNDLESNINTDVAYFEANGYQYKEINLGGEFKHKMFNGKFDMSDENAEVHFDGTIDLNKEIPIYKFKAKIDYADLKKLKIDTSNTIFSTNIDIDFAFKNIDNNQGHIELSKILFIKNGIDYPIEQAKLIALNDGNKKKLSINMDMLTASMEGEFSITQIPKTLLELLHRLLPNYTSKIPETNIRDQQFDYQFSLSDSRMLSELFFPYFHAEGLTIDGNLNGLLGDFTMDATAQSITYNQYKIQNIHVQSTLNDNDNGSLNIMFDKFNKNDSTIFNDIILHTNIANSIAVTTANILDTSGLLYTTIKAQTVFNTHTIETTFDSTNITIKQKKYTLSPATNLLYDNIDGKFTISNFKLFNPSESLIVNGFYNLSSEYNIHTEVNNISLSIINILYNAIGFNIDGTTDGTISLKGNKESNFFTSNLSVQNLALDNDTIGNFEITSNYDEKLNRFITYVQSTSGKVKDLEFGGYIDFSKKPFELNFNLLFAESDLKSFQAFVKTDLTIYYGRVSAKCKLTGTLQNPEINGYINAIQVLARVEYLKTVYGFNSKINLTKNRIDINSFQLTDNNGKKATVEGTILHQSFSNFVYDIKINELNGFQVLNTTSKDNSLFYGKAYATGRMSLKGTQDNLLLDATLKSSKGTIFSIPLSDNENADGDGLLNYIDKDTTLKSINIQKKSGIIGLGISMLVTITPDAQIQLVFDESQDDKIIGTGRGTLKMELTKQGLFNMYGEVAIEAGEYKFTAVDVFTRKFILKKGGTITWTGDPLQARMNIQGVYKVRSTSIADIITTATQAEKDAARQQRVPVECILILKGNLLNPDIGFDLNFPDNTALIGNNVSALENSLRRLRSEPEIMQQQVVSLMLFGSFVPIQGYEQVNYGLNNTLSDLISAQASGLLSRYIPGFEVSADYQAKVTANQQDKAILTASKKLLKERLEVQTSFDILGVGGSNFTGQIMGQYNLRADGNLKLRGFNRTANNPYYNKNVTSQGIGLYYRKEFDKFNELFKKKTSKVVVPN